MATYNEKSIKHLSGLTGIRRAPEMYVGSVDAHGVWTLIREPADNAVDEFLAGRNKLCHIIIENGQFWILDMGEGIPIGEIEVEDNVTHRKHKVSALMAVVGLIHSGAKFEKGSYKKGSRGTHGVGIKASNALSKSWQIWTCRSGKWFTTKYAKGKLALKVSSARAPKLPFGIRKPTRGTVICLTPDPDVFDTNKFPIALAEAWAKITSVINSGLLIKITDSKGKTVEYLSKQSVESYVKELAVEAKAELMGKAFAFSDPHVDIALAFTDYDGTKFDAYTNGLRNVNGGVHVDTFYLALARTMAPFKKKKHKFKPSDLRDGIIGLINFKVEAPKFTGQTKEKLSDARAKELLQGPLEKALKKFFAANKSLVARLLERANKLSELKVEFTKNKTVLKKLAASKKSKSLLPGKLKSAPNCKPHERELYLVEGDSAEGTTAFARDNTFQEVLPLRGKFMNVYKDKDGKALESQELMNILMAIGFDPSTKSPMDNLRIGKLMILPDADVDGSHIAALCKAIVVKYLPEMLQRGMVYVVKSPEYMAEGGGARFYGKSVEDIRQQAGTTFSKVSVRHLKGLAEMSSNALREVAFDPKTRRMLKIDTPSKQDLRRFKDIMGEDVSIRKELLGI